MSEPWWAVLQAEWDGVVCVACEQLKWAKHPFCRLCSIRLQRVGLMSQLQPLAGHAAAALGRTRWAEDWMKAYDRARDYLIVSKRNGEFAGKHKDDEREQNLTGPFPRVMGACEACRQSFAHSVPSGMQPKTVVDLVKFPDFDFSEYPDTPIACKWCWRPLNGAADSFVRAS
jgi:hypothetical protein